MCILKLLFRTKIVILSLKCFSAGKEDKSVPPRTKIQEKENLKLNDVSYRSWRLGSLYENGINLSQYLI